jgi:hypothetical protein
MTFSVTGADAMQPSQPTLRLALLVRFATRLFVLLAFVGFVAPDSFAQATATYDSKTRYLTLPSVQVSGTMYSNVIIRLDSVAVVSIGTAAPTATSLSGAASFDAGTRYLSLPSVLAAGTAYYGMVVRLDGVALISVDPPEPPTPSSGYNYGNY